MVSQCILCPTRVIAVFATTGRRVAGLQNFILECTVPLRIVAKSAVFLQNLATDSLSAECFSSPRVEATPIM